MSTSVYEQVEAAAETVSRETFPHDPTVGIVLGSGLGSFAETLEDAAFVPYGQIPGFAESKVVGHVGRLVAGVSGGTTVLAMQGRVHCYEGHPIEQVVLPIRTMVRVGCKIIVITNAAGGIRTSYTPGDLALITDHINMTGINPLMGDNDDRLGPRFPDMSTAYDKDLRELAHKVAADQGISLKEGVYNWLLGPTYETPAEIRMARTAGADLAGMSTVPEVIAARHMGARILGVSCVTNMAAGLQVSLSHEEVKETAQRVKQTFIQLVTSLVAALKDE